jgi:hypothetical protein
MKASMAGAPAHMGANLKRFPIEESHPIETNSLEIEGLEHGAGKPRRRLFRSEHAPTY